MEHFNFINDVTKIESNAIKVHGVKSHKDSIAVTCDSLDVSSEIFRNAFTLCRCFWLSVARNSRQFDYVMIDVFLK